MQIQDIGVAARNLADYIDVKGEGADVQIVTAQISLIVDRARELKQRSAPQETAVSHG